MMMQPITTMANTAASPSVRWCISLNITPTITPLFYGLPRNGLVHLVDGSEHARLAAASLPLNNPERYCNHFRNH